MRSRDECPQCRRGRMLVDNTVVTELDPNRRVRKQYLRCTHCDHRGKSIFLVDEQGRRIDEVDRVIEQNGYLSGRVEELTQSLIEAEQRIDWLLRELASSRKA
jgi:C4-type Zn-finger protein